MTSTYQPIDLLKRRRTRIVATVGPASSDRAVLESLIRAGVNVFRLNLSHGEHATHRTAFDNIRAAAANSGEPIAVLADLCGPKIRCGRFRDGHIELGDGDNITVTTRDIVGEPGAMGPGAGSSAACGARWTRRRATARRRWMTGLAFHRGKPPRNGALGANPLVQ